MAPEPSHLARVAFSMQVPVREVSGPQEGHPVEFVSSSFAKAERELRAFLHEDRPTGRLLRCLEGAVDKHLGCERPPFLPMLLPLLVRGAIDGQHANAVPVSTAATLLFLSFDLLDDLQDGDERDWWQPLNRAELLLAAATFPATLPLQILLERTLEPVRAAAMSRALARDLEVIAAGQGSDLAAFDQPQIDLAQVEQSVEGKSGAQMGLYARLAALHAGKEEAEANVWAAWAHGIGTAGQLGSDLQDVLDRNWSRDLAAGARTLPIAFALQRLGAISRPEAVQLLQAAKTDRAAQRTAREWLRSTGAVLYTAFRAQVHLTRAEAALSRLDVPSDWRHLLQKLSRGESYLAFPMSEHP